MSETNQVDGTTANGELTDAELMEVAGGTPATTPSGSGSGKAHLQDIHFTKTVDNASAKLFTA